MRRAADHTTPRKPLRQKDYFELKAIKKKAIQKRLSALPLFAGKQDSL